jgi:hypothetical protein
MGNVMAKELVHCTTNRLRGWTWGCLPSGAVLVVVLAVTIKIVDPPQCSRSHRKKANLEMLCSA